MQARMQVRVVDAARCLSETVRAGPLVAVILLGSIERTRLMDGNGAMDSDDERIAAIARVLLDDGYIDDEGDAHQAAARILDIVQAQLPSEAPDAVREADPAASRD